MARSFASANLYEPHGEVPTKIWFLLPLRLYVGGYFLAAAWEKIGDGFLSEPDKLIALFRPIIEGPDYPFGFYHAFYKLLIAPHPGLFAFLVVFGELMTGLAILTGTMTRLACWGGLFMMLNFFLAFNPLIPTPNNTLATPNYSVTFAVILLVLLVTGAGRAYGVDHYLRGKAPSWVA
jgi:thiosulfate dehydrogenase [quinone] large subunit